MNDPLLSRLAKRLPMIELCERAYRLPPLKGTERQQAWARMIRADFIPKLLRDIPKATKCLSTADAKEVFRYVTAARNERRAKVWIQILRFNVGAPAAFILSQPAKQAEQHQKREEELAKQKRSKAMALETRKVTETAGEFEQQHRLPAIESHGFATTKRNFGRRCRFMLLRDLTADELVHRKDEIDNQVEAGYWIGQFLKHEKPTVTVPHPSSPHATKAGA